MGEANGQGVCPSETSKQFADAASQRSQAVQSPKIITVTVSRVSAKVGLPFGVGELSGDWLPDNAERDAAWEMYVELVTRVGVVELGSDQGLMREALSSLHSLFETTRDILRRHGPGVAHPTEGGSVSFGHLAVAVLNGALRPLLATWHPLLSDHEAKRPDGLSSYEWERAWDRHDELRSALAEVGDSLSAYASLLGRICGAPELVNLASLVKRP